MVKVGKPLCWTDGVGTFDRHKQARERCNLNLNQLTFEMFLFRCHHLVRGRFTHSSRHLGSREAVLRRGDAVRQCLTRHLSSLAESNALTPVWRDASSCSKASKRMRPLKMDSRPKFAILIWCCCYQNEIFSIDGELWTYLRQY